MTVSPKLQLQQLILLQKIDYEIVEHRKQLADIPVQINSELEELVDKRKSFQLRKKK